MHIFLRMNSVEKTSYVVLHLEDLEALLKSIYLDFYILVETMLPQLGSYGSNKNFHTVFPDGNFSHVHPFLLNSVQELHHKSNLGMLIEFRRAT